MRDTQKSEPIYHLQTFAGLSAWHGAGGPETPILSGQRKRLALLATLAADGNGGVSRDRLLTLFWPEADATRARNALKQLVHAIRRDTGADVIRDANGMLSLASELIDSDVQRFRAALTAGTLALAVELYRGPFLDGVYLHDVPEFERWVDDCRRRFAREYVDALARLIESALEAGEASVALPWARALASADPLGTRSVLSCMRAFEAAGDVGAAIEQGELHARLFRQELDAPPPVELERALRELRQPRTSAKEIESPSVVRGGGGSESEPAAVFTPDSSSRPTGERLWSTRRATWTTALACAALVIVAAARRATTPTLDPRRVAIANFDNETGDSTLDAFGRIATNVITEQLGKAGFVSVVDPTTARTSSNAHAGIVVTGGYFLDGGDLVAQARVTNVATHAVLAATDPVRAPRGNWSQLVEPLRQRVMGAVAARVDERLSVEEPRGRTPKYDAYRTFVAGLDIFTSGHFMKSIPYFKRAYALDTTFMAPLFWEAETPISSSDSREVNDILERHRAEMSAVDRDALDYDQALQADRLGQAAVIARNAARLAPGSRWTGNVATLLFRMGRLHDAVAVWSTIDLEHYWLRRAPGVWYGYIWLLHDAGEHGEELKRAREARALLPESPQMLQVEVIALAMNHEWREFDQRLGELEQVDPDRLGQVATELRVHGERDRANAVFDRGVNASARRRPRDAGADAQWLSSAGRWPEAARLLDSLYADVRQPPRVRRLWVMPRAIAHARIGDRALATAVLDSIAGDTTTKSPQDLYNDARLAAALGDRTRAITFLTPLRNEVGDWQHYNPTAGEFEALVGYGPYEALRAGR